MGFEPAEILDAKDILWDQEATRENQIHRGSPGAHAGHPSLVLRRMQRGKLPIPDRLESLVASPTSSKFPFFLDNKAMDAFGTGKVT